MAKTALIGYTGFVGSNLAAQHTFDDQYNTSNIADIAGKEYDLVVSAANRAEMWRINQEPDKDRAEIDAFIGHIGQARIKQLVLISTVGVYKRFDGVDEATAIELEGLPPYGANRYHLERFCRDTFDTLIVRLPGLFGPGLKKNVIFDLLHHNNVERLHYAAAYQYYNLERIWRDIETARRAGLSLVNLAAPPVTTKEVAEYCFGLTGYATEPADVRPAAFDMRTKHADLYHGDGPYIYGKQQELDYIKAFVEHEKRAA